MRDVADKYIAVLIHGDPTPIVELAVVVSWRADRRPESAVGSEHLDTLDILKPRIAIGDVDVAIAIDRYLVRMGTLAVAWTAAPQVKEKVGVVVKYMSAL